MTVHLMPYELKGQAIDQLPEEHVRGGYDLGQVLMGIPALHKAGFKGKGDIGIIDSGIDYTHPDLGDNVVGRRDYVNDGRPPVEYHSHGTHVAGTVGANGKKIGCAPEAGLRDYRVLNAGGQGTWESVAQAIRDATDDGCIVINMSLGGKEDNAAVRSAIRYADEAGVLIVAAVGNDGPNEISYPGYYSECIGAAAAWLYPLESGYVVMRALFSQTNDEVDVASPGVDVYSTMPGGKYGLMSGTSMASPHGAGYCNLKRQKMHARRRIAPSSDSVWDFIKASSIDLGAAGVDSAFGAGFLSEWNTLPLMRSVAVTKDAKDLIVNGSPVPLDVSAQIINGRFVVPFRALLENGMGARVSWDDATKTGTGEWLAIEGLDW